MTVIPVSEVPPEAIEALTVHDYDLSCLVFYREISEQSTSYYHVYLEEAAWVWRDGKWKSLDWTCFLILLM